MFGLQMINEMDKMQREMEHVLRGFGFNSAFSELNTSSRFKVSDKGEAFEVEAALPGLDIEKLDINILGRRLTLSGEFANADAPKEAIWHRRERQQGCFEKSLQLTANIDTEKVEAEYQQGILRITLPKAASALPKKISVKTA